MIHASKELIRAIAGEAPSPGLYAADQANACDSRMASSARVVIAFMTSGRNGAVEDKDTVTCPACLVRMDAAMEGTVLP